MWRGARRFLPTRLRGESSGPESPPNGRIDRQRTASGRVQYRACCRVSVAHSTGRISCSGEVRPPVGSRSPGVDACRHFVGSRAHPPGARARRRSRSVPHNWGRIGPRCEIQPPALIRPGPVVSGGDGGDDLHRARNARVDETPGNDAEQRRARRKPVPMQGVRGRGGILHRRKRRRKHRGNTTDRRARGPSTDDAADPGRQNPRAAVRHRDTSGNPGPVRHRDRMPTRTRIGPIGAAEGETGRETTKLHPRAFEPNASRPARGRSQTGDGAALPNRAARARSKD